MKLISDYNQFIDTYGDPRTKDWYLSSFPICLLLITSYVYFCTKVGPWYMKNRQPYSLIKTVQLYNVFQIFYSVLMVYEGWQGGWFNGYNFICEPVEISNNPQALRMVRAVWLYYVAKITELLDTVFFVLRKKTSQVSYLHVFHHAIMLLCGWTGLTFVPGGHPTLMGFLNAIVHVFMYLYYLLSSLGPSYRNIIWWKRYLTILQMIQLAIITIHNFQVLFRDCNVPSFISLMLGLHASYICYLFAKFYKKCYIDVPKQNQLKSKNGQKDS